MNNLVLDTNIILLDANNLFAVSASYPDYNICLPDTVIEELDSKKSSVGEIGYQARQFGRMISGGIRLPSVDLGTSIQTVSYQVDSVVVSIISAPATSFPASSHENIANDDRIIHTATLLPNCTLMSNDIMCRIRAESKGLTVVDFKQVDKVDLQFMVPLSVSGDQLSSLHNLPIDQINPDHKPFNFSYLFTSSTTGETKVGLINNGTIKIIGKDTERNLRDQAVNPRNLEQLVLSALIQDPTIDIVIAEALSGSGKTILSVSNAMKLVDMNIGYDSIIYVRNTINDTSSQEEEVGFLKGSLEEKTSSLMEPFYDSLSTIIKLSTRPKLRGKELDDFIDSEMETLVNTYNMSTRTTYGLRGRTIDNSVIIIDEAQNFPRPTIFKLLSRIGKNCKVILIGSLRQIDSKYITKYTSGLSILLNATTRSDWNIKLGAVTLNKVLRGPITEFSEKLFSKKEQP